MTSMYMTIQNGLRDQFLQDYNRLTQRRVVVAEIKCSSQLGNAMSD